jgi:ketosteroid isomerase-like protein
MQLRANSKMLAGGIMPLALFGAGLIVGFGVAHTPTATAADSAARTAAPTAATAWAAEQAIAQDMQDNNAEGIERALADDWAVIPTSGGLGEGKTIFPQGITSGVLTRKTFVLSEPRVRLYGNIALVTAKVQTSGTLQGKPFDVAERQTDILHWDRGGWKSVLTHETKIAAP